MKLSDMRDYVSNILDYNPSVQTYRQEVDDALNENYMAHFVDRPWEYSQKEIKLVAKADEVFEGCTTSAAGKLVIPNAQKGTDFYHIGAPLVVEFIEGSDGTASEKGEYIIEGVSYTGVDITLNVRQPEKDPKFYSLDQRLFTFGNNQTEVKIKIKHRKILMPKDCVEVMSIGLRGLGTDVRQPFYNIPKFLDEKLSLDLDETGTPTDFLVVDPFHLNPPHRIPTIDTTARANSVNIAGDYKAAYSFYKGGVIYGHEQITPEIVLPESSTMTMTAGTNRNVGDSIRVEEMEVSDTNSGLQKRVYVQPPEDVFKHFLMYEDDIPPTTSLSATSGIQVDFSDFTDKERLDEQHTGTYQRIRLYPRQDTDQSMTVRYIFRPARLQSDDDIPEMPADTHLFLCYKTLVDIFNKHNNAQMASFYSQKAQQELLKIENRYLSQRARLNIKQGFRQFEDYYKYPFIKITRR